METLELKAPDISCGHCVNAIRKAVTRLGGGRARRCRHTSRHSEAALRAGPGQQVRDRASVGRSGLPGRRLSSRERPGGSAARSPVSFTVAGASGKKVSCLFGFGVCAHCETNPRQ